MKYNLPVLFFVGLAIPLGCTNSPAKPPTSRMASSLDSIPPLPRVDPKTLIISDISVSQFANPDYEGAIQPLVDFRHSGSAEYVEAVTCIDETGECSEAKNLFKTEFTLANQKGGAKVIVKLRACVDPARSTGASNCGEWFQSSYTQWTITNQAKAALMYEEEQIEIGTKELKSNLEKLFKLKSERAAKCQPSTPEQKALLDADRALAETFGKMGQSALGIVADALSRKGTGTETATCSEGGPQKEEAKEGENNTPTTTGENGQPQASALNLNVKELFGQGVALLPGLASKAGAPAIFVDKFKEILEKRASSPGNDGKEAAAAAQCIKEQTQVKGPGITVNDVAAVLPQVSTAIFDLTNAERVVALEGICIGTLGQKFETAIDVAEATVKSMATRLQERRLALKAKSGGNK